MIATNNIFVKILLLIFCFTSLGCGFHFAQKPVLVGKAKNISIREIKNYSRTPNVDFLLERELKKRLITTEFYTEAQAELEFSITVISVEFAVQTTKQDSGEFYTHSYKIKAKVFIDDLRNLQPAKKERELVAEVYLELQDKVLDDNQQDELQLDAIYVLTNQSLSFMLE